MKTSIRVLSFIILLFCPQYIYNYIVRFPAECINAYKTALPFVDVDFDVSMQRKRYEHIVQRDKTEQLVGYSGEWLMDFFKKAYNKVRYKTIIPSNEIKIPRKIHQIWIGDGVPKELKAFQQSIKNMHPDWEYRLWTQDDIDKLDLVNKDLIKQATNPAEKSDLLRYELLYKFGGVYLDMDCQMLQPLDMLHYIYDFYIGIQPLDTGIIQLGIGVIGSIPQHPMIKACIKSVRDNYTNPNLQHILTARTGPIHFTRIFVEHACKSGTRDIAFPAHYFYPLGSTQLTLHEQYWKKIGSYTIHHWAKTWNKPQFRRKQFQTINSWGTLL